MDGKEYPWVKSLDDNLWHKRPVTDEVRDSEGGHTYRTICGLEVGSAHVSQVPPHETRKVYAYSNEHGCRKCLWLENWEPLIEIVAKTISRFDASEEHRDRVWESWEERVRDEFRAKARAVFVALNANGYRVRVK